MQNQLILKVQANIEKGVKPADRAAYDKIVMAGTKVMYSQQTHKMLMEGFDDAPDKVKAVAEGMVGLMGMLFKESRNTMPITPMIQAGMTLMLDALDFLEQAGYMQVTEQELGQATKYFMDAVLPKIGITPQMMQQALAKTQGAMQDPQKLAQIQQSMGG